MCLGPRDVVSGTIRSGLLHCCWVYDRLPPLKAGQCCPCARPHGRRLAAMVRLGFGQPALVGACIRVPPSRQGLKFAVAILSLTYALLENMARQSAALKIYAQMAAATPASPAASTASGPVASAEAKPYDAIVRKCHPSTNYDIDRRALGKGSFGTVFQGVDKSSGLTVALKFSHNHLKEPAMKGARDEAVAMQEVSSSKSE